MLSFMGRLGSADNEDGRSWNECYQPSGARMSYNFIVTAHARFSRLLGFPCGSCHGQGPGGPMTHVSLVVSFFFFFFF